MPLWKNEKHASSVVLHGKKMCCSDKNAVIEIPSLIDLGVAIFLWLSETDENGFTPKLRGCIVANPAVRYCL